MDRPVPKRLLQHFASDEAADGDDPERPRVRGDCQDGPRPCPWVACKYHLYLDVNEETGNLKIYSPDLEPDELPETCALDVAERSGVTLEDVGRLMNLTRERIRQIEVRSMARLHARLRVIGAGNG